MGLTLAVEIRGPHKSASRSPAPCNRRSPQTEGISKGVSSLQVEQCACFWTLVYICTRGLGCEYENEDLGVNVDTRTWM